MNTLTLRDFVEQLTQSASLDARVVFKIECEDKNFDANLEFSRVTCLSPATEVVVTMADNTEDVRTELHDAEEYLSKVEKIRRNAEVEEWSTEKILKTLDNL